VYFRYGEKNNAFIVASFENEDENKDEISKKVTRALDKVTSDYHSGSSSSDEETSKEVEVKPNSVTATPSPVYQVTVKLLWVLQVVLLLLHKVSDLII
jgi:protein Tob/BTG